MTAGIQAALTTKPRPNLVVVLIDGFTPWPRHRISTPVIVGLLLNEDAGTPPEIEHHPSATTVPS